MKVTITKKEVLDAIRLETLVAGFWITNTWAASGLAKKDCKVCAVGGVLRRKVAGKYVNGQKLTRYSLVSAINRLVDFWGPGSWDGHISVESAKEQALAALARKQPLAALSTYFESLVKSGMGMAEVRKTLSAFVREEFPKSFTEELVFEEAA